MRTAAYSKQLPLPQTVALPPAQTPPRAAQPDLAAAQKLSEVEEARITVKFKAGYNVAVQRRR